MRISDGVNEFKKESVVTESPVNGAMARITH